MQIKKKKKVNATAMMVGSDTKIIQGTITASVACGGMGDLNIKHQNQQSKKFNNVDG